MISTGAGGEVLGGLALAGIVVREVFNYLKARKEPGGETEEYRELKLRSIINEQLMAFFAERDMHIRNIVRDEIEKHHLS